MTIELPGPLVTVLDIVGFSWPRADEDKLFAAAQQWSAFADKLNGVAEPASNAAQQVVAGNQTQSTEAFGASFDEFKGKLGDGVTAARLIGGACTAMGTATVVLKGAIIAQLVILAAELAEAAAQAILTGIETLGIGALISAGQGAAEVIATRTIIRELLNKAKSVIVGQIKKLLDHAKDLLNGIKSLVRKPTQEGRLADDAGSAARTDPHARTDDPAATDSGTNPDGTPGTTPGTTATSKTDPANPSETASSRPDDPSATKTPADQRTTSGDPIDVVTGDMVLAQTDVQLAGVLPLILRRTHVSSYRAGRLFGRTWTSTMDQRLEVDPAGAVLTTDDGMLLVYPPVAPGTTALPTAGPRWPLERTTSGYTVTKPDHILHFPDATTLDRQISAIVDRNGNRIDFDRDATGTPTAVRHSGGYHLDVVTSAGRVTELRLGDTSLVRFGYDDDRLAEVLNSSGRALRFEYDVDGRITQWTDRNGEWYRYIYDEAGRCVANEGSGGFLNGSFVYLDRTTRYTDALGHTTIYLHNDRRQVVAETDALGNTTTSEWDEFDHLLTRTDPLGRTTTYTYDADGNPTAVTRPDGATLRSEHNAFGLPTRVFDVDGSTWGRDYDEHGNLVAETDPAGATTRYTVDSRGHVVAVTDAEGNTTRIETNAAGLPVAAQPPQGGAVRYDRDEFGRIIAMTDQLGGTMSYSWTVEGNLVSRGRADGSTEFRRHDSEGNEVEYIDALGQTVRTTVTHFDLPATEQRPDGTRLAFGYDPTLRLTSVTNGEGLVWRCEYDAAGNLVRETDFNGMAIGYAYDAAGQLTARTDADGHTTAYTHDLLGNVVERQWSTGERATYAFDLRGDLVRAVNGDAELTYERDTLGRVLAETINGRTVTSAYDALGRRIGRRTPTGAQSAWAYGADHQPISLQTAGRTMWFRYDVAGREVERLLDTGTVLSQSWDANHRLAGQTVASGAGRIQQRQYGYRADDSVTSISDQLRGDRRYDLDRVGRVVGVSAANWQEQYAYDQSGNIASGVAGAHVHTGTLLRETGSARYVHDARGRVIMVQRKRLSRKPDTWRYSWNGDNRLIGVVTPDGTQWRYRYDPLGRRIAKQRLDASGVAEEIVFAWDGSTLVEQIGAGRATTWEWEPDGLRAITQVERVATASQQWVDDRFYSIVTDLVGTPSELVDSAGELVWHANATLWGLADSPASTPLRFPCQYHDLETGLNYNYHRYYDPEAGNYQSPDPLGLAGGENPHGYVPNPTGWIDPLGLTPCEEAAAPYKIKKGIFGQSKAETEERVQRVVDFFDMHGRPPALTEQGKMSGLPKGVWGNKKEQLPVKPLGYYKESDVQASHATTGNRGGERLVFGREGEVYYTNDHYRHLIKIRGKVR